MSGLLVGAGSALKPYLQGKKKMIIVAVYDKKSKLYENPIVVPNASAAVRGFAAEVMRGGTPFSMFAEDFELHQIGEWHNNETENAKEMPIAPGSKTMQVLEIKIAKKAEFVTLKEPLVLAAGSAFKKQQAEK